MFCIGVCVWVCGCVSSVRNKPGAGRSEEVEDEDEEEEQEQERLLFAIRSARPSAAFPLNRCTHSLLHIG